MKNNLLYIKNINYNPKNHPKSQSLPKFLALNFAINIIDTKKMREKGRIVGNHFVSLILNFPESLDIDENWQFKLGNALKRYKIV